MESVISGLGFLMRVFPLNPNLKVESMAFRRLSVVELVGRRAP